MGVGVTLSLSLSLWGLLSEVVAEDKDLLGGETPGWGGSCGGGVTKLDVMLKERLPCVRKVLSS